MIKPITIKCVSVAHLMPVAGAPMDNYWQLRRAFAGGLETLQLEENYINREQWATDYAARFVERILNDFNLTCYQSGGEYKVEAGG